MTSQDYLLELGLDPKEVAIYLACLKLGEGPIMPIVKEVDLPRSTVYHLLERLRDLSLIEIIQTLNRRIYSPHPPRALANLLKKRRQVINHQLDNLDTYLPTLHSLYADSVFQPKIRFFRNKEIRTIYEEILDAPINEVWYISEVRKAEQVLGKDYLKDWIDRRIKKRIKTKAIWIKSEAVTEEPNYRPSPKNLRSVRYAPADFRCPAQTMIYGDNVVLITSTQENIGLVISSRDYAISMKHLFKQLWKLSSKR